MEPPFLTPILRTHLDRQVPFSFSCMRCLQCCHHKKIQVNPYEIARLASNLGISTTECIAHYTVEEGTYLKFDDNNTCIFLGSDGCKVHSDRPLVCRLYPLGRQVNQMGDEWFLEVQLEVKCKGVQSRKATIEEFLEAQGAPVYMLAADNYLTLLWDMMESLDTSSVDMNMADSAACPESEESSLFENNEWIDMDAAVRKYCAKRQIHFPDSIEEKMRIHLDALYLWINQP